MTKVIFNQTRTDGSKSLKFQLYATTGTESIDYSLLLPSPTTCPTKAKVKGEQV